MSKTAEEYNKEFDSMYGNHTPDLPASKAEQAALKAYPVYGKWVGNQYGDWDNDINRTLRKAYLQGYKQAEKDTIERAIAWLKEKAKDYIVDLTPTYPDAPSNIIVGGMCWEDLKKAMEEEE